MTSGKGDDKSPRKRTLEFDWFVRDLEPDKDDNIRGGGEKTGDQEKPDDRKTERPH